MRRQKSPFPLTAMESQSPRLRSAPLLHLLLLIPRLTTEPPCAILLVFFFTLGFEPGIYVMSFLALKLNGYIIFYLLAFTSNCVPCAALPEPTWLLGYEALVERLRS